MRVIEERTVVTYQCDGCQKMLYGEKAGTYSGVVNEHLGDDVFPYSAPWFACRARCRSNAMDHVLTKAKTEHETAYETACGEQATL